MQQLHPPPVVLHIQTLDCHHHSALHGSVVSGGMRKVLGLNVPVINITKGPKVICTPCYQNVSSEIENKPVETSYKEIFFPLSGVVKSQDRAKCNNFRRSKGREVFWVEK